MIINEAYEAYTMLFGFFLNNRIWDLLIMTGAFAVPILIMVSKALVDAYQNGDDEGDRGSMALRYIEVGTIKIIFVMVFFMMPLGEPLQVSSVSYNNHSCKNSSVYNFFNGSDEESLSTFGAIAIPQLISMFDDDDTTDDSGVIDNYNLSINGVTARPPIMIGLIQNFSTKFTNAIVSTIPCASDIVSVGLSVQNINIKQKDTQDLLTDVIKQCYAPLWTDANKSGMDADEVHDKFWIGAPYFTGCIDSNGSNCEAKYTEPTSTANVLVNDYVNYVKRAYPNEGNPILNSNGVYAAQGQYKALDAIQEDGNVIVQCDHYYDLLKKHVAKDYAEEIDGLDNYMGWVTFDPVGLSNAFTRYFSGPNYPQDGTAVVMKRLVEAVNQPNATNFEKSTNYDKAGSLDTVKDSVLVGSIGKTGLEKMVEAWYVRVLANPILAMIQAVIFMMAPIIFLLSNYNMKIIGSYLVTIFGLEFIVLIFEVCDWFNDSLFTLSSSAYGVLDTSHMVTQSAIFSATKWAYFILPLLWVGLLGKVGMMVSGNAINSMNTAGSIAGKEGAGMIKTGASVASGNVKGAAVDAAKSASK